MSDRKLLNIELGRIKAERYRDLPPSGLVVVLDNIRSLLYDEGVMDTLVEKVQIEYAKLQKDEAESKAVMQSMWNKARKELDHFYDRIRAGEPFDEIDEAEFKRSKDALRSAEFNLKKIETNGHLPKPPASKIKEYIYTMCDKLINEESTVHYRALLENLIDSVRVGPSTVTIKLKVRYSWCARRDSNARPSV